MIGILNDFNTDDKTIIKSIKTCRKCQTFRAPGKIVLVTVFAGLLFNHSITNYAKATLLGELALLGLTL